jgi:ParB-like chromosome segregation protein Spo0J
MKIKEITIDELIPYENNPRYNDDSVDAVVRSIEEFGFKVPIIIDSKNIIVAGHTRLKAAKKLGMSTVPVVIADDLTPYQIKAFRIADNKVGENSYFDDKKLLAELESLNGLFTGFEESELFREYKDSPMILNEVAAAVEKTNNENNRQHENSKTDTSNPSITYKLLIKSSNRERLDNIFEIIKSYLEDNDSAEFV